MRYRLLGCTGIEVSTVVLGTMTFGREADEETCAALYATARDAGVNLIDTADGYAGGRSEEILGELIAPHRHEILLATKAGSIMPGDRNRRGASRRHLVESLEGSLRRLRCEHVDIFYIHYFDPSTVLDDSLRALDDLISTGKIRYSALSNFAAWQVAKALGRCELRGWNRPACIQPMYSLLKRQAEVEIFPLASAEALGVLTYSPLASGILSGKYTGRYCSSESARLTSDRKYQARYPEGWHYSLGVTFAEMSREAGVDPVTAALAWCLHNPAVTAVIAGARSVNQLEPALAAGDYMVTEDFFRRMTDLVPLPPLATDREEDR